MPQIDKPKIVLMVQSANTLFCYYNISPITLKEFTDKYGEGSLQNSKAALKVYSVDNGVEKELQTIFIDPFADNWYIHLDKGDIDVFVKLGRYLENNTFVEFAVSNIVTTPRLGESEDRRVYYIDVSEQQIPTKDNNEKREDKQGAFMKKGYVALVLHSHIPFIRHPEKEDALEERWLFEAMSECYIPLIGVYDKLIDEHIDFKITMSITPTLMAMLQDPYLNNKYIVYLKKSIELSEKEIVRNMILNEKRRPDGRAFDEIRPISCEVGLLPRTHGTGLFTRGLTQVMTVATIGPLGDVQILDGIGDEESKRYMHHYNFPSYSTGEVRPLRGPGRREIGHGALAEKALEPLIPSEDEFPYAIRLVSEVLSSNGSTSQASVCGSTLALLDAGVPIRRPAAGIAIGLVTSEDLSKEEVLTDIQGIEDFFGDMDFKVAGTAEGITAIQVDTKIHGLSKNCIKITLEKAKKARLFILEKIKNCIPEARKELSPYAPRVYKMSIDPEKIRDVIGAGGKTINKIIAETGVKIDIKEDGKIYIMSNDSVGANRALKIIDDLTKDVEVGEIYLGKVTKITNFGAFVEILPGKEGLVHISKLDFTRVNKVEDIVSLGDEILVKVTDIDEHGRINLSRRDAIKKESDEKDEIKQQK